MATVRTTRHSRESSLDGPLSQGEVSEGHGVGERLRAEIIAALRKTDLAGETALGLSRCLNLNRNIVQRIMAGLGAGLSPLQALAKFPGAEGMMLFARALNERSPRPSKRSPLIAAAESYEHFLQRMGGSQASLIKRIERTAPSRQDQGSVDTTPARKRLYESAAELLGYSIDTLVSIAAVRPIPDSPRFIEGLDIVGSIGIRAQTSNVTIVASAFGNSELKYTPLAGGHPAGLTVMEEFSSTPLPLSSVEYGSGKTRTVVEFRTDAPAPSDYVLGYKWRPDVHPLFQTEPEWFNSMALHRPTRRLIFDVYMHRSMAIQCVPAFAPFLWNPSLAGNPSAQWNSRLPGRFPIELLGSGLGNVASNAWHSHSRLVRRAFELAGWDPQEFVGYRCDVPYPIWGSVFYMTFDFRGASGAPSEPITAG